MAQNMPDKRLYRSPIFSGWLEEFAFDSSKNKPRSATPMAIIRALVNGSESQNTPSKVDQIGVK